MYVCSNSTFSKYTSIYTCISVYISAKEYAFNNIPPRRDPLLQYLLDSVVDSLFNTSYIPCSVPLTCCLQPAWSARTW